MTPEERKEQIIDQIRMHVDGTHYTQNRCKCKRWKRSGLPHCVCCLADMLRQAEHEIEIAKLTEDLKQMSDLYQGTL